MAMTFLVGLDGSDASERALDYAITHAGNDDTLGLVHIIEWSPFSIETMEENEYRGMILDTERQRAREDILDPAAARVRDAGKGVEVHLLLGKPAEELHRLSDGADLIVIGKTGQSALKRLLVGSRTHKILQLSTVPVVIVP